MVNSLKLNKIEAEELLGQFLIGALYGLTTAIIATDTFTQATIVALSVTALKTGAHYVLKALQPKTIREGKQYKKEHWSEKAEKVL